MSTITNNSRFITVVNDLGSIKDFRKSSTKFSTDGTNFIIQDSENYFELDYSLVTSPTSTDAYDLRDQVNAFFP